MKRLTYLCLLSLAMVSACDKIEGFQQTITSDGLSLSHHEVEIYPGGGSVQILLTSGATWSMSKGTGSSWLSINDLNGNGITQGKAGTTILTLASDVNQSDTERSSTLTFKSANFTEYITITQKVPYLRVKHADNWLGSKFDKGYLWCVSAAKPDQEHVFKIESNTWWKITGAEEEFILNQTEGEGDFTLTVLPKDINVSAEDNTMFLTLEGADDRIKYEMEFVQDNLVFILHNNTKTTCDEFGMDMTGIIVESEVNWHLTESRDGWSVSGPDSGVGVAGSPLKTQLGTLKIHPNETREQRNHKIEFFPEDPDAEARNVSIVYEITQDRFVFDVDGIIAPAYKFGNRESLTDIRSCMVNSSSDWYIDNMPSWIDVSDETKAGLGAVGGNADEIVFAAKGQNLELTDNSGIILLKNYANDLEVPISVTQDKFQFTANWNSNQKLEAVPENEREEYHTFNFKTSGPWHIDKSPTWLEVPVSNGSYDDDQGFTIKFKANSTNTDEADRTGEIRFISDVHEDAGRFVFKVVTVTQNGFKFYLGDNEGTADDVLNDFSELGTDVQKIKITSPTQWRAQVSDSWISVDPAQAISGAEVSVSVDMNTTKTKRSGKIAFTNNDVNNGKGKTIEVLVSQAPYVFNVDFGASSLTLDPVLDPSAATYKVNVTSSGRWMAETDASWVSLSSNGANSSGMFNITIDNNLNSSKRSANVVVTNLDLPTGNTATLQITQEGFVFNAECKEDINFSALPNGKSYKITYNCSAGLQIDSPDWVNCEDRGNGTIIVTADDNVNNATRTGNIKLSNMYTSKTQLFYVTQSGYEFSVSGAKNYSLDYEDNADINLEIVSSGRWSASSDVNWLTISPVSGNGNAKIKIAAKDNTVNESRKGVVTIKSDDNTNLQHQIVLTQEAAPKKK